MRRIVAVDVGLLAKGPLLRPANYARILNAVLGQARLVRYGAQRIGHLWRIQVERALDARGYAGQDDARIALEALGAAVDKRHDGALVERARLLVVLEHGQEETVDPASRQYRVQAAHDDVERAIEVHVHVLYALVVGRDGACGHTFAYELGGHLGLGATDIGATEQELPIEVGQVDGVHVDYVQIGEAHVGEHFEQFAAETARSHDQQTNVRQTLNCLAAGLEVFRNERGRTLEQLTQVSVAVAERRRRWRRHIRIDL